MSVSPPAEPSFAALALEAFAFLLENGFTLVRHEPTLVRLERAGVVVEIVHGRSSHQVGLELSRLFPGDRYSLLELLRHLAPDRVELAQCQSNRGAVLARCLAGITEVLRERGASLLSGDTAAFAALRADAAPARDAATLAAALGPTLDRADRAWEAKDFRLAAELYREAEPALDATRRRRLAYLLARS